MVSGQLTFRTRGILNPSRGRFQPLVPCLSLRVPRWGERSQKAVSFLLEVTAFVASHACSSPVGKGGTRSREESGGGVVYSDLGSNI